MLQPLRQSASVMARGVRRNSRRHIELDERRRLLRQVASRTIGSLGPVLEGAGRDPSGRAHLLRQEHRLFGVRPGWRWCYPEFQFDAAGLVYPEMTPILLSLPDEPGWNRLRWFLTPNERLSGRMPLHIWESDRERVVLAAARESDWKR